MKNSSEFEEEEKHFKENIRVILFAELSVDNNNNNWIAYSNCLKTRKDMENHKWNVAQRNQLCIIANHIPAELLFLINYLCVCVCLCAYKTSEMVLNGQERKLSYKALPSNEFHSKKSSKME